MANNGAYIDIQRKITESTSLARDVDKQIDDLITLVINKEGGPDSFIVAFCYEIEVLKEFQRDMKNAINKTILKFCGVNKDQTTSEFGDYLLGLMPKRGIRSKDQMKQVTNGIELFKTKEKMVTEMVNKLTSIFQETCSAPNFPVTNFRLSPLGYSEFDLRQSLGVNERFSSLREVMIDMYNFSMDIKVSDDRILREFKPTGFLIFQSEEYKSNKENLEDLLRGMNETDKTDDQNKDNATVRMTSQLYTIEGVIANLVRNLCLSIGSVETTLPKLEAFEVKLRGLKLRRKYRVPLAVFWCASFILGEKRAMGDTEKSGDSELETLLKRIDLDAVLEAVYEVILQLVPVLNASTLSNSNRLKKKALLASFRVLQKCEQDLESIRLGRTT